MRLNDYVRIRHTKHGLRFYSHRTVRRKYAGRHMKFLSEPSSHNSKLLNPPLRVRVKIVRQTQDMIFKILRKSHVSVQSPMKDYVIYAPGNRVNKLSNLYCDCKEVLHLRDFVNEDNSDEDQW